MSNPEQFRSPQPPAGRATHSAPAPLSSTPERSSAADRPTIDRQFDVPASLDVTAAVVAPDGQTLVAVTRHIEPAVAESGSDRDLVIIAVSGQIDLQTVALLRMALLDATARRPHVCCDLTDVTFFGAAGANALVAAHHQAVSHGCRFSVRGAHGIVRRILDITRLDQMLTIES